MKTRKSNYLVTIFVSVPSWHTSSILQAVPVRAHVCGKTQDNNGPRHFDHTYEFADFHLAPHSMDRNPYMVCFGCVLPLIWYDMFVTSL